MIGCDTRVCYVYYVSAQHLCFIIISIIAHCRQANVTLLMSRCQLCVKETSRLIISATLPHHL